MSVIKHVIFNITHINVILYISYFLGQSLLFITQIFFFWQIFFCIRHFSFNFFVAKVLSQTNLCYISYETYFRPTSFYDRLNLRHILFQTLFIYIFSDIFRASHILCQKFLCQKFLCLLCCILYTNSFLTLNSMESRQSLFNCCCSFITLTLNVFNVKVKKLI